MAGSRARPSSTASASTKRSRRDEGRRAARRRELALQAAALRDATPPRAVHAGAGLHGAAALGPLGGQPDIVGRGGPVSARADTLAGPVAATRSQGLSREDFIARGVLLVVMLFLVLF